jgi:glycosyltransferase involved in cell wall biosynthesis
VLFLTRQLQDYRIPIFKLVAEQHDVELTVAHSGKKTSKGEEGFKEILINEKTLMGFSVHSPSLYAWANEFDVVVAMLYLKKFSFMELALRRGRKFALIYWGIGVRASQTSKYNSRSIFNAARYFFAKKADALIFYSDRPIPQYLEKGFLAETLFVMNNTVAVLEGHVCEPAKKSSILFIGTLKKSKKIFELLEAYKQASAVTGLPVLEIVGGGEDAQRVKEWVAENKLEESIKLFGPIYEEETLAPFFRRAFVCVSPGQAGLSVLKSFGYGVPFVTRCDAITGGERFNIVNEKTGVLLRDIEHLKDVLIDVALNPKKYQEMGLEARKFYSEQRRPDQMAQEFLNAIDYAAARRK